MLKADFGVLLEQVLEKHQPHTRVFSGPLCQVAFTEGPQVKSHETPGDGGELPC